MAALNRLVAILAILGCNLAVATPSVAGDLTLFIRDGLVTLDARDVSTRQILAEWARVGETIIVNADRVEGPAVTLQLANVPERQALDLVLRPVAGYAALLRSAEAAGASDFSRIHVLPASSTPVPLPADGVIAAQPPPAPDLPARISEPRVPTAAASAVPRASVAAVLPTAAATVSSAATARPTTAAAAAGPVKTVQPVTSGVRNFARRPPVVASDPEDRQNRPSVPSAIPGFVGGQSRQNLGSAVPGVVPRPAAKP